MNFTWIQLSNPVALWWIFLVVVAIVNILIWVFTFQRLQDSSSKRVLWLSSAYVFGCAFRSFLPRADVQRICLFDTWFSSVFVGRSVATVAEVCFIAQWALILNFVSTKTNTRIAEKISFIIVPLIVIAECFSWFAVITTSYLGNTFEESIWGVTYSLITISLIALWPKFKGPFKNIIGATIVGCILYIGFMATVDVPMYLNRWQSDIHGGKNFLGFYEGLRDLNTRWVVTHNIDHWRTEIPWMSLYFSFAVWASLGLCYVPKMMRSGPGEKETLQ